MKRFSVLILTAILLSISINAQSANETILVSGNPPLTQTMIDQLVDFFEFALNGKFTDAQRAEFQKQRINEWRNGTAENKQTILSLLEMRSGLLKLNNEQLRESQAKLQNYFVETFSKAPNDETAKLMLEVYENGKAQKNNNIADGVVETANLFGTWQAGTVSGVNFVNQATGSTTNGGGTQILYTFHPNGTYEFAALTSQTMYNCHTEFMTYKTGVVSINGGVLTFIPKTAKFTSKDSCVTKNNYQKPAGLERETYNWSIQRDEYGPKLCLQNSTTNGCAYKSK